MKTISMDFSDYENEKKEIKVMSSLTCASEILLFLNVKKATGEHLKNLLPEFKFKEIQKLKEKIWGNSDGNDE